MYELTTARAVIGCNSHLKMDQRHKIKMFAIYGITKAIDFVGLQAWLCTCQGAVTLFWVVRVCSQNALGLLLILQTGQEA